MWRNGGEKHLEEGEEDLELVPRVEQDVQQRVNQPSLSLNIVWHQIVSYPLANGQNRS